jgi:hypothetical protein
MKPTFKPLFALTACAVGLSLLPGSRASAQDQTVCGASAKETIVKELDQYGDLYAKDSLKIQDALYEKYQKCAIEPVTLSTASTKASALVRTRICGSVAYAGSRFYEEITCCGYDPQKQQFACPVEIKQTFGFGPAAFPGSREHVLSCVDFGAGFVPVAEDSVHLANAVAGAPNWYFAVIADASGPLLEAKLSGKPLLARSILSWQLVPTGCNYKPIWGNVLDYQIRLDP